MSDQKQVLVEVISDKDNNDQNAQPDNQSTENKLNQEDDKGKQNNKLLEDEVNEVLEKMDKIDLEANQIQEQETETKQAQEQEQQAEEFYTRDLIDMTKTSINFNKNVLFPGAVEEAEITIYLKQQYFADIDPLSTYKLKVLAICNEAKFNDLDEYVFSVRKSERFQYFEEVFFQLCRKDKAQIKVAVKVPPVLEPQVIEGALSMQLANTKPVYLPITAKCQIPQIVCLKQLQDQYSGFRLIKIPGKKGTMRMPPVPFKNNSPFNFFLQVQMVSSGYSDQLYDVIPMNSTVSCSPNTPFFVTLQLKPNLNYRGVLPETDVIRKVLILKVRNSSVHFSYPIEVYVYESSSSNVS